MQCSNTNLIVSLSKLYVVCFDVGTCQLADILDHIYRKGYGVYNIQIYSFETSNFFKYIWQHKHLHHFNRTRAVLVTGVRRVPCVGSTLRIISTVILCAKHLPTRATSATSARRQRAGET